MAERVRYVASEEPAARTALMAIAKTARTTDVSWALIGGQGLLAHGIPRDTLDLDILVPPEALEEFALNLTSRDGWVPLRFDQSQRDYVDAQVVMVLTMQDDPVLMDIGEDRSMIALRCGALVVELLAAQHPVEQALLDEAHVQAHHGVSVPVAPLGGILLVKAKAHRLKDLAALEQAAEHLDKADIDRALRWARRWDPATTEDLESILMAARMRRAPSKETPARRRR